MKIDAKQIKQLREESGLGVMDCKKALEEADGDVDNAREVLKKRGAEIVANKSSRIAKEGIIASYVHTGGKIGVLVEVNCETDFVARNEVFQGLARNICLQVVATSPAFVRVEEIPEEITAERRKWAEDECRDKPAEIREKIIAGKLAEFYKEKVLLNQPFVREPEKTIQDYLNEAIARLGENISIRRFIRLELGG